MRSRLQIRREILATSLILLILIATAAGCANSSSPAPGSNGSETSQAVATSATTAAPSETQTFTREELAAYDGQDGRQAYIAIDGIVYDVTLVAEWGNKMHAGRFTAGKDYSEEIKNAPHGVDKLLKAVKIGVLAD